MSEKTICYYDFGDFRLDVANFRLMQNGSPVPLTQKSFEILQTLIENKNRVVEKDELLRLIWGDYYVEEATLTQHIYMLRKALKQNGGGAVFIETIPKHGYRFTADVRGIFQTNGNRPEIFDHEFEKTSPAETFIEKNEAVNIFPQNYNSEILPASNSISKRATLFASLIGVLIFSAGSIFYLSLNITEPFEKNIGNSIAVLPFRQVEGKPDENYTKNSEAHQAFSMGLFQWNQRTGESLEKAIGNFQTAIKNDPEFALGYAYLADTYMLIGYYETKFLPKDEAAARAKQAALKALELDPLCSEAMTALAIVKMSENRRGEGFELLKKAIEIKPDNAAAHQRIAWAYAGEGDLEKALEEMRTAQNLDPQARNTNIGLATVLNIARRPADSMIYSRRVLEFDPENTSAKFSLANSLEQTGEYGEAERIIREIPETDKNYFEAQVILSRIFAKTDRESAARKILQKAVSEKKAESLAYQIALTYTALGDEAEAVRWLEKSAKDGGLVYFFIRNDYNLDSLRRSGVLGKFLG